MVNDKFLSKFKLYIKLPDYVAAYLRSVYGGKVLVFAPDTIYYSLMRKSITSNTNLYSPHSTSCWSQKAVDYAKKMGNNLLTGVTDVHIPCLDDIERLQPVYMPSVVGYTTRWNPDESCQMNRQGTTYFLAAAKQEFWEELFTYVFNNRYKRYSNGLPVPGTKRSDPILVSDFLTRHRIDDSMYATVLRRYYEKLNLSSKRKNIKPASESLNN